MKMKSPTEAYVVYRMSGNYSVKHVQANQDYDDEFDGENGFYIAIVATWDDAQRVADLDAEIKKATNDYLKSTQHIWRN